MPFAMVTPAVGARPSSHPFSDASSTRTRRAPAEAHAAGAEAYVWSVAQNA
jgi:hypothetical protein